MKGWERLKELHDIDAALVSLNAILEVAADLRAAVEAELNQLEVEIQATMEKKNEEWAREQADHDARTRMTREREEEEYAYKLTLKRWKEADDYTAQQAARSEVQKQASLDAKLVKMETEAERNVTALKIAGLEDLVKRQTVQLEALTKQLSAAQAQVQAMAVKAIEGAAGMKSTAGQ